MPKQLDFVDWTMGGTLVTYFDADRLSMYQTAVRSSKDPELAVLFTPASLHCTNGLRDLGTFWKIFRDVEWQVAKGILVLAPPILGIVTGAPGVVVTIVNEDHPHSAYDRAMGIVGK